MKMLNNYEEMTIRSLLDGKTAPYFERLEATLCLDRLLREYDEIRRERDDLLRDIKDSFAYEDRESLAEDAELSRRMDRELVDYYEQRAT